MTHDEFLAITNMREQCITIAAVYTPHGEIFRLETSKPNGVAQIMGVCMLNGKGYAEGHIWILR